MIEIVHPGPLATVQDVGRPGYADLGVARSGAFDRAAQRAANRLVGNGADAAAIELTLGGLEFHAHSATTVALTGAACPGLDAGAAVSLAAGSRIRLGPPATGLRSYLAVRGGIAVAPVLGSRSTDTLSGLGPAPLRPGDRLDVGREPAGAITGPSWPPPRARPALRVVLGPREDWFTPDAVQRLCGVAWTVRADSNRVGVRLDGPPLERARTGELASEPTLPGALQVPPDGRPILLGPDAPVTGGYPVFAVLREAELDAVAQLRPGQQIWFVSS